VVAENSITAASLMTKNPFSRYVGPNYTARVNCWFELIYDC
jgi:hypothetical protein